MQQPPGFTSHDSSLVCKLHKSIYRLEQAPRLWFFKLSDTLQRMGFHASKSDYSLFVKFWSMNTLLVLVYVDDIIIKRSSSAIIQDFINGLQQQFALKDLGRLHYFLGIEVSWLSDRGFHLSQAKYIIDLLQKANMLESNPQPTSMVSSLRLTLDGTTAVEDPKFYRSIVGSLQYVTVT